MRASKYQKISALLSFDEMARLVDVAAPFNLFEVGRVVEGACVDPSRFLHDYASYIERLQRGESVEFKRSFVWTREEKAVEVKCFEKGELAKAVRPLVHIQPGRLFFSETSGEFQVGTFGDSLSWGLQFSFPFLFQDDEGTIFKVDGDFPNTALFKAVQRYLRHATKPTPFIVDEKVVHVPIRLGKECFSWIQKHPQLTGLQIAC